MPDENDAMNLMIRYLGDLQHYYHIAEAQEEALSGFRIPSVRSLALFLPGCQTRRHSSRPHTNNPRLAGLPAGEVHTRTSTDAHAAIARECRRYHLRWDSECAISGQHSKQPNYESCIESNNPVSHFCSRPPRGLVCYFSR